LLTTGVSEFPSDVWGAVNAKRIMGAIFCYDMISSEQYLNILE
jgi:hypothetical protein